MNVAVFHNRYGPAVVFTLPPGDSELPEHASIPQGPFPRAFSQFVHDKGTEPSWAQWAEHLAGSLPYFGEHWTVEQVPDGYGAKQALAWVRSQEAERNLTPSAGE